jgi:hypothetical protein
MPVCGLYLCQIYLLVFAKGLRVSGSKYVILHVQVKISLGMHLSLVMEKQIKPSPVRADLVCLLGLPSS